jgi:hypothetical protein
MSHCCSGSKGEQWDVRQGRVRLGNDAVCRMVRQKWSLKCVDVGMEEDLRAAVSSSSAITSLPPRAGKDPCLETHLVRGRFDLGRRQQDRKLVDAKVADADAPAGARAR